MASEAEGEFEVTPAMLEAGLVRLGEVGEVSSAYLAGEVFLAMLDVALREGLLLRT